MASQTGACLFAAGLFLSKKGRDVDSKLGQINIENVHLPCKDLPANPCREIIARRTCFAVKR
jgi:hypothetical protein